MTKKIFLSSEIEQSPMEKAMFSVLPVPFEKSVSYGSGTAKGPQAIIEASDQLETLATTSTGQVHPCEYGIHTCDVVDCSAEPEIVMDNIASEFKRIINAGSIPVMLGGEHSVTYGAVKGLIDAEIGEFGMIQFDAHADLRDAYEGDKYSHASVMKRVVDADIPLFQLGVRAFCDEEQLVRKDYPDQIHYIDAIDLVPNNVTELTLPESFPDKVFITFDIDGLDPSIVPATGTPVQGGIGWYQALSLIESIARQREVIGFDVVELAPIDGFHVYDFATAQLVYQMMAIVSKQKR